MPDVIVHVVVTARMVAYSVLEDVQACLVEALINPDRGSPRYYLDEIGIDQRLPLRASRQP